MATPITIKVKPQELKEVTANSCIFQNRSNVEILCCAMEDAPASADEMFILGSKERDEFVAESDKLWVKNTSSAPIKFTYQEV